MYYICKKLDLEFCFIFTERTLGHICYFLIYLLCNYKVDNINKVHWLRYYWNLENLILLGYFLIQSSQTGFVSHPYPIPRQPTCRIVLFAVGTVGGCDDAAFSDFLVCWWGCWQVSTPAVPRSSQKVSHIGLPLLPGRAFSSLTEMAGVTAICHHAPEITTTLPPGQRWLRHVKDCLLLEMLKTDSSKIWL